MRPVVSTRRRSFAAEPRRSAYLDFFGLTAAIAFGVSRCLVCGNSSQGSFDRRLRHSAICATRQRGAAVAFNSLQAMGTETGTPLRLRGEYGATAVAPRSLRR